MRKLIFIYNLVQAKFIMQENSAKDLYKIGKGSKGDICISFLDTPSIRTAISKWCDNNKI